MIDRVPVKDKCADSGPILGQQLYRDCFLVDRPVTVRKILLYCEQGATRGAKGAEAKGAG